MHRPIRQKNPTTYLAGCPYSFLEVARECNVSGAAIHQRIQKLKNNGIIKGSEFIIDNYKVGYQTCAFIGVTLSDIKAFAEVAEELKKIPEIVECHYSTGKYSLFVKIYEIGRASCRERV